MAMSHTQVFEEIGVWWRVADFLTKDVFHNWWMCEHYAPAPGLKILKGSGLARLCTCVWAREAMSHSCVACTAAWQLAFVSRHMRESVLSHCWGRECNAEQRNTEDWVPPRVKEEQAAYFAWKQKQKTKPMPLATYDGPGTCGGLWQEIVERYIWSAGAKKRRLSAPRERKDKKAMSHKNGEEGYEPQEWK